jgi:hypothetical protein
MSNEMANASLTSIEIPIDLTRTEKIKQYFKKNKKIYVGTACGIVVGAVGMLIVSVRKDVDVPLGRINQIGFWNEVKPTTINLVERSNPSKPVHLVGTDLYFDSMSDAARKTGHHLSMLSKHLKGEIPDLKGDVFELLVPAE